MIKEYIESWKNAIAESLISIERRTSLENVLIGMPIGAVIYEILRVIFT